MKGIYFFVFSLIFIKVYSQSDTSVKLYDGWKKGNGTFSLKLLLPNLEKYVTGKYTLKKFESSLGDYEKQWYGSDTVYKNNNVDLIDMPYAFKTKADDFDVIHVRYNINQFIQSITFFTREDDLRVNKLNNFIKHIKAAGYEFDLRSARLREKFGNADDRQRLTYLNRIKKFTIVINVIKYDREYEISLYRN